MPLQLLMSWISGSTQGEMVQAGFFSSDTPSLLFSAADNALRLGFCSLAPKTRVTSSMVSSRTFFGAPFCREKARLTQTRFGTFCREGAVAPVSWSANVSDV